MWHWFGGAARCPVAPDDEQWLIRRLDWLTGQFGAETLRSGTVILPTYDFFPDKYPERPELSDIEGLCERVCRFMDCRANVGIRYFNELNEEKHPRYEPGWNADSPNYRDPATGDYLLWISANDWHDQQSVISALAHEVAMLRLDLHCDIDPDVADLEALGELLTLFFGMGIFSANSVIQEGRTGGLFSATWMRMQSILTMDMYGHAFALYARRRGEDSPDWLKYLRLDVRSACKRGLRYLEEQELRGIT